MPQASVILLHSILIRFRSMCPMMIVATGYIDPECPSPLSLNPAHTSVASEMCETRSSSDLETMGLLQRSAGFSEQLIMDDCSRAALFSDQKSSASPTSKSDAEEAWQLHSTAGIELQDNPSGRGRRREHSRLGIATTMEWYEGPNPGRLCKTCGAWQLLRTHHCHDCNQCIEKFDHHCHWIGTCIGHGNQHLFWAFLLAQTILIVICLAVILESMTNIHRSSQDLRLRIIAWVGALLPLVLGLLMVGGLLIFHTYLLCTNQTTFELAARWKVDYLKDLPMNKNPFNQGCVRNLIDGCCPDSGHVYKLPSRDVALATRDVLCAQGSSSR